MINQPTFMQRVHSKFCAVLRKQTAKGIATYGMTLDQNAKWDNLAGAYEELVDAIQYVHNEMERRDAREAVDRERERTVREVIATLEARADAEDLREEIEMLRGTLTVADEVEVAG